jgi:hypothetical protein
MDITTYEFSDDVLKLNPGLKQQLKGTNPSKYGNVRAQADGMVFASGREAAGVAERLLQEKQGIVFGVRLQVPFILPGGIKYVADATYGEMVNGKMEFIVEDWKGFRKVKVYLLKKKLMKSTYGIDIRES